MAGSGPWGFAVRVDLRLETFARLGPTAPAHPGEHHRVELVASWRAHPPVEMDLGPVLRPDGVLAGKADAWYNGRPPATTVTSIDGALVVAKAVARKHATTDHWTVSNFR